MSKDQLKKEVSKDLEKLITNFKKNRAEYIRKDSDFDETEVRTNYIDPLFYALNWDVNNKRGEPPTKQEVRREKGPTCGEAQMPVPIKEIVNHAKLDLFPKHKFRPIIFKGRTVVEISRRDFLLIEKFMRKYKAAATDLFQGAPNEGNLGAPIDLDILNYAPTSEQGVVVLFAAFMKELPHGFVKMEFVRSGFPDACVIQREGNLYARRYIEFEFRAGQFKDHIRNEKHRVTKCDYVVCWENDFHTCPIPVIELKTELEKLSLRKKKMAA